MGYKYTRIDGERVQVDVAAAFRRLDAGFRKEYPGLHLIVASGTRTTAEQRELYARYKAGTGNLAAYPGTSNHEESGPAGPRALDVWDSGADPGVTTSGTRRANWLRSNASRYGFNPAGYGFSRVEPWHIEYTGALTNNASGQAAGSSEEDDMTPEERKMLRQIHHRVHKGLTGPRIAASVWAQGGMGGLMKRTANRVLANYDSIRHGKKGVRTTGSGLADLQSRLGRLEIMLEKLLDDKSK